MSTPHLPDDLIDAYLDGNLDAADLHTVNDRLAGDRAFADAFAARAQLHGALRRVHANGSTVRPTIEAGPVAAKSSFRIVPLALAAAVLIASAVVMAYLTTTLGSPADDSNDPDADRPLIATLVEADGTLVVDDAVANPGDTYHPGTYVMESGSADLLLTSGTTVRMRGRTTLTVRDPMESVLDGGSVGFHCPPMAVGYTVHLPGGARVVDLGTDFDVSAHHRRAVVRVHEGRVRVIAGENRVDIELGDGVLIDPDATDPARVIRPLAAAPMVGGEAVVIERPLDIASLNHDRRRAVIVIDESDAVTLAEPVEVTIAGDVSGKHVGQSKADETRRGVVDAGRTVRSVMLAARPPVGTTGAVELDATVSFDRPIVGVITTDAHLAATDALFGLDGFDRALAAIGAFDSTDRFEISADRRTITVHTRTAPGGGDHLRLLIESDAAASTPLPDATRPIRSGETRTQEEPR